MMDGRRVLGEKMRTVHALTQSEELGVGEGRTRPSDVCDVTLVHPLILVAIGLDVEEGDTASREVDAGIEADARRVTGEVAERSLVGLGVEVDALPVVGDILAPSQEVDLATIIKVHFTGKTRLFSHESASIMNSPVGELCVS